MAKKEKIVTDPFGSYTGLVKHPEEKPVQDADDLWRWQRRTRDRPRRAAGPKTARAATSELRCQKGGWPFLTEGVRSVRYFALL